MVTSIVRATGCETYLELGLYVGETFEKVFPVVRRAIGVDTKDVRSQKIGEFHQCTTDEFFLNFRDMVDLIFIDADHRFESTKKDFLNSINILNRHGLILIHDTDPITANLLDAGYCGDSYKMINYIHTEKPDFNIVTLPIAEAGLSIITRKSDRRVNDFLKEQI
jgi:predicted O-methyltransferase YrrM